MNVKLKVSLALFLFTAGLTFGLTAANMGNLVAISGLVCIVFFVSTVLLSNKREGEMWI